ncbi:TetR/AcrR family transcriptional regulator [Rhodococcus erythropolis]|uniref:TetR/AcrR family transcriptional regulator n=3 Tax=Rhodococcus erythropolis TaxID=1833 RepID=A0AAX3V6T5_RHOER|nr:MULTISPECIES: TetR/AcrR family transcriptional regulator [Rhodococcus]MCD2156280.1 TetR/AcrR family transcriptional regulator [Rhodococcus cerastii]MDN5545501.1 TetR/AcrR family transcriptional regulator [Rhodococcus sp. (in: high G+C Gram-positive bacteria)]AGT95346.1 TetR family transcriptional regulator [Rhodococcus erythropolis CCM2595]MCQ4125376.1 TetR/AcrR family transcriptional regulator [Rhodococcus erythropolis]MCW2298090.1 TetR/AcrR family transcriptional repressor of nem operon [
MKSKLEGVVMGRVSQQQAEENRRRVVETAARLFREKGTHLSVADLMKASGLTHGGFYKQFASKDALIDEATTHAFAELAQLHAAGLERHAGQRDEARQALIDNYLSVEHRDNPADGCPAAALAADMAREPADSEARRVYVEGVGDFAKALADEEHDGLVRLSTMIGALVLSRATKGSSLSEEVLVAAREELTG